MLRPINLSKVMQRLHERIEQHNAACATVEHTRTLADGTTRTITRRVGIIREAVITTFHQVARTYLNSYIQTVSTMPAGLYTMDDLPSAYMNCVRLAESCKATDRTVRNHLKLFKELGFINTEFHGSKKSFEVWISPQILFSADELKPASAPQNLGFSPDQRKSFPHNHNYGEIIEKEKRRADMLVVDTERTIRDREAGQLPAATAPQQPLSPTQPVQGTEENSAGPRRTPLLPEGISQEHGRMLLQFWLHAWKMIYPNREFSMEQQDKAIHAIFNGVYGGFADKRTTEDWFKFQIYQMDKLDKAGNYYDLHPDKYPGDPYSVFIKGRGYFDAENKNGFIGIDAWMKRESIQKAHNRAMYKEAKTERLEKLEAKLYGRLRIARKDFEKLHAQLTPRKEVANLSEMGLFKYHETIFKGFGQKWVDLFAKQYLNQKANNFTAPKYSKARAMRQLAGEVVIVQDYMTHGNSYYS